MVHYPDKLELKEFLEEKYKLYANPKFVKDDPIQIPHRYSKKEDIEISGLLTSTIAWGNRKMIIYNADRLLRKMGESPYEFVLNFDENDHHLFNNFVHRTFNQLDCINYIEVLKRIYVDKAGLEHVFTRGFERDHSVKSAIDKFRSMFIKYDANEHTLKHVPNVYNGSAAKRINMFLRWMVRPSIEGVDFGIWKKIPSSALMMPLDTHSGRVARSLGILSRNQNDWKSVEELTVLLREFDSNDPVKYDYALFGLGVFEKFGL